jgi:hypothetical protein
VQLVLLRLLNTPEDELKSNGTCQLAFIDVRLLQFWKAFLPIELIEDGRSSVVKPQHPVNTPFSIIFTEVGISIVVNPPQPQNA